jgi:hypothetical protein
MEDGNNAVATSGEPCFDRRDTQAAMLSAYSVALCDLTKEEAGHFLWMLRCVSEESIGQDGLDFFFSQLKEHRKARFQLVTIHNKSNAGQLNRNGIVNDLHAQGVALRCGGIDLMLDVKHVNSNITLLSIMERAHQQAKLQMQENPRHCFPDYIAGGRLESVLRTPWSVYSVGSLEHGGVLEHSTRSAQADGSQRDQCFRQICDLHAGVEPSSTAIPGMPFTRSRSLCCPLPIHY